jgi:hypothetical protein
VYKTCSKKDCTFAIKTLLLILQHFKHCSLESSPLYWLYTRAQFSGRSSTTNARSETGQIAVCCQNLTLGALSSHSVLSVLVGALFKKFGLFLNTPRMYEFRIKKQRLFFREYQPIFFVIEALRILVCFATSQMYVYSIITHTHKRYFVFLATGSEPSPGRYI